MKSAGKKQPRFRKAVEEEGTRTLVMAIDEMFRTKSPMEVTDEHHQFFESLLGLLDESSGAIPSEFHGRIIEYFRTLQNEYARYVVGRLVKFMVENDQEGVVPDDLLFQMMEFCLLTGSFPVLTPTFLQIVHLRFVSKNETVSARWRERFSIPVLIEVSGSFTPERYDGSARGDVLADWLLCVYDHLLFSQSAKDIGDLIEALSKMTFVVEIWLNSCCNFLAVLDQISQSQFMDPSLFNKYTFPAWILAMTMNYERPEVVSAALQVLGSLLESEKYELTMALTSFDMMALLDIAKQFSSENLICQQALYDVGLFIERNNDLIRPMIEQHWEDAILDWFADSPYSQKERIAFLLSEFVKAAINLDIGEVAITQRITSIICDLLNCDNCELLALETVSNILLYKTKKEGSNMQQILASLDLGETLIDSLASLTDHDDPKIASHASTLIKYISQP